MNDIKRNFRIAILLRYSLDDSEKFKTDLDFGLVKAFLKSAHSGGFEDDEIIEHDTSAITKEYLIGLISQHEYSFIYFSGHSYYYNRRIGMPLLNQDFIFESELILRNNKQWIFLDCCRTNRSPKQSPEFNIPRHINIFTPANNELVSKWRNYITNAESFFLLCYTTEINSFAYSNEFGGYGTQLFFMTMMKELIENSEVAFTQLVKSMNKENENVDQKFNYINGIVDLSKFPFKFSK